MLIVEEDPGIAELERDRLEEAGYQVVIASETNEALRSLKKGDIDLILPDYHLRQDTDGWDFYERIKTAGYDLPVILVTGCGNEATVIRALRLGVRDFVTKSMEYLDYLPDAVGRILGQVRTEQQLARIIASANDAIICTGSDRLVTLFNPAAERMFRLSASKAGGQPVTDIIPDDSPSGTDGVFTPSLTLRLGSWRIRHGGERFPLEVSISRGETGRDRFYTLIVRDVSERKRMEAKLRQADELLAAVVEGTADTVFVKDREGRYLLANPALLAFIGRPKEEVLGRADTDLFEPESVRVVLEHDRRVVTSGQAITDEEVFTSGGTRGGRFW